MRGRLLLHGSLGLLFLLSAAVQLNDPDPLRWVLLYVAAALLALAAPWRPRRLRLLAGIAAAVALGWALTFPLSGLDPIPPGDLLVESGMKTEAIERWRECLGLVLVGSYHLGLLWWLRPPPLPARPAPAPPAR